MSDVRLHVLLAKTGALSRRRAEDEIRAGRVTVNGNVIRTLGTKVDPDKDVITLDGEPIRSAQRAATIVLHKPDAVVTTMSDPEGRETVAQLVKGEPYKLRPVGRLDYHTEGVLLLTTDGELANRLLHPRHHVPKTYLVKVAGKPSPKTLDRLRSGVALEDGKTRPAIVEVVEHEGNATWLEMILTEGRNRLVRRMCDQVHHQALRVVRTGFATIDLGDLRPGQYRYLTDREKTLVYTTVGLSSPELNDELRPEEEGYKKLGTARRRKGPIPGTTLDQSPRSPRSPRPRARARGRSQGRSTLRAGRSGRGAGGPRGS